MIKNSYYKNFSDFEEDCKKTEESLFVRYGIETDISRTKDIEDFFRMSEKLYFETTAYIQCRLVGSALKTAELGLKYCKKALGLLKKDTELSDKYLLSIKWLEFELKAVTQNKFSKILYAKFDDYFDNIDEVEKYKALSGIKVSEVNDIRQIVAEGIIYNHSIENSYVIEELKKGRSLFDITPFEKWYSFTQLFKENHLDKEKLFKTVNLFEIRSDMITNAKTFTSDCRRRLNKEEIEYNCTVISKNWGMSYSENTFKLEIGKLMRIHKPYIQWANTTFLMAIQGFRKGNYKVAYTSAYISYLYALLDLDKYKKSIKKNDNKADALALFQDLMYLYFSEYIWTGKENTKYAKQILDVYDSGRYDNTYNSIIMLSMIGEFEKAFNVIRKLKQIESRKLNCNENITYSFEWFMYYILKSLIEKENIELKEKVIKCYRYFFEERIKGNETIRKAHFPYENIQLLYFMWCKYFSEIPWKDYSPIEVFSGYRLGVRGFENLEQMKHEHLELPIWTEEFVSKIIQESKDYAMDLIIDLDLYNAVSGLDVKLM